MGSPTTWSIGCSAWGPQGTCTVTVATRGSLLKSATVSSVRVPSPPVTWTGKSVPLRGSPLRFAAGYRGQSVLRRRTHFPGLRPTKRCPVLPLPYHTLSHLITPPSHHAHHIYHDHPACHPHHTHGRPRAPKDSLLKLASKLEILRNSEKSVPRKKCSPAPVLRAAGVPRGPESFFGIISDTPTRRPNQRPPRGRQPRGAAAARTRCFTHFTKLRSHLVGRPRVRRLTLSESFPELFMRAGATN